MRKIISFLLLIISIALLVGCDNNKEDLQVDININNKKDTKEIIKVMEKVYLDYIYDIYLNKEEYLNNIIEVEGIFTSKYDENSYYVYRLSDTIQEHDGEEEIKEVMVGFKFDWNGKIPNENDWIKVIGTLKENDNSIVIDATSVEIMKERGIEKVEFMY